MQYATGMCVVDSLANIQETSQQFAQRWTIILNPFLLDFLVKHLNVFAQVVSLD